MFLKYIEDLFLIFPLNHSHPIHSQKAFAWFSDLLVEHAEMFWSMFACDMERVLAEQPPDTWDSFPLFQVLNDYLRMDGKVLCVNDVSQPCVQGWTFVSFPGSFEWKKF